MNKNYFKKINILFYIVSLVLFVALYGSAVSFGYIWDDSVVVVSNPLLLGRELSWELLAQPVIEGTSYFRPLAFLSWYIERTLFDLNPVVSHAVNLLFFYGSTLLVFFLIRRILQKQKYADILAFFGALIFLSHPRNVEAAAWISGRFDVLATFFLLAGWVSFISISRTWLKNLLVILFHIAALASKEIGILMPIVLFCLWMLVENQPNLTLKENTFLFLLKNKLLIFLMSIVSIIYLYMRSNYASGMTHVGITWKFIENSYFVSQLPAVALKEYILRTILPFYNMGVFLPIDSFTTITNRIISVIVCLLVVIGSIWALRKRYTIVFAVIAYIVMISLVLYFIPITTSGITQDRFLMSALPFYSLFVAYIAQQMIIHFHKLKAWIVGLSVYVTIISLITLQIVPIWANSVIFWIAMSSYQEKYTNEFHPMLLAAYASANLSKSEQRQKIEELISREREGTKKTGMFRPIVYIIYAQYLINEKEEKGLDIMEEYIDVLPEVNKTADNMLPPEQIEGIYTSYAQGVLQMRNDVDKADAAFQQAKKYMPKKYGFDILVYSIILDILKNRTENARESYKQLIDMNFNHDSEKEASIRTINKLVTQVCQAKNLPIAACQAKPFDVDKFLASQ